MSRDYCRSYTQKVIVMDSNKKFAGAFASGKASVRRPADKLRLYSPSISLSNQARENVQ